MMRACRIFRLICTMLYTRSHWKDHLHGSEQNRHEAGSFLYPLHYPIKVPSSLAVIFKKSLEKRAIT